MHRTKFVPKSVFGIATAGLIFGLAAEVALAQPVGPQSRSTGTVIRVPVGQTKKVTMSQRQLIAEVNNQNPKVARVQTILDDPTRVLVTGLSPGYTTVALKDKKGNVETFNVDVPSDERILREANRKELLKLIRAAVPASSVQVLAAPNGTVILNGTVARAEDVQVILQAARSVFGEGVSIVNGLRLAGVHQVQLDVIIATVNRSEARSMNFDFIDNGDRWFLTSILSGNNTLAATNTSLADVGLQTATGLLTGSPNLIFGILPGGNDFTGFLQALRNESLTKIIAEPRLVTLSGRPAQFISGGEQAVPTLAAGGAGGGAVSGVEFVPFGTTVSFLPIVLGDGKIYMEVTPEFTAIDAGNAAIAAPIPGTAGTVSGRATQRVQTSVIMEDGQTFAIGGLIQNTAMGSTTKVPVLGDLPYFGALFRTVSYTDAEQEVLILVTPRLVDPMACNQVPKFVPGQETRSPSDFELFLEGILEAPRGPRQTYVNGTYRPAHHFGPTANKIPCAGDPPCIGRHAHGCNGDCGGACMGGNCAGGSCVDGGYAPTNGMMIPGDAMPGHGDIVPGGTVMPGSEGRVMPEGAAPQPSGVPGQRPHMLPTAPRRLQQQSHSAMPGQTYVVPATAEFEVEEVMVDEIPAEPSFGYPYPTEDSGPTMRPTVDSPKVEQPR